MAWPIGGKKRAKSHACPRGSEDDRKPHANAGAHDWTSGNPDIGCLEDQLPVDKVWGMQQGLIAISHQELQPGSASSLVRS